MDYELTDIIVNKPAIKATTKKGVTPRRPLQHFASATSVANPIFIKQQGRKRQVDRLLKQLPLSERRRQQQIRQLIQSDPLFGGRRQTLSI
jgi:hypothetical protein